MGTRKKNMPMQANDTIARELLFIAKTTPSIFFSAHPEEVLSNERIEELYDKANNFRSLVTIFMGKVEDLEDRKTIAESELKKMKGLLLDKERELDRTKVALQRAHDKIYTSADQASLFPSRETPGRAASPPSTGVNRHFKDRVETLEKENRESQMKIVRLERENVQYRQVIQKKEEVIEKLSKKITDAEGTVSSPSLETVVESADKLREETGAARDALFATALSKSADGDDYEIFQDTSQAPPSSTPPIPGLSCVVTPETVDQLTRIGLSTDEQRYFQERTLEHDTEVQAWLQGDWRKYPEKWVVYGKLRTDEAAMKTVKSSDAALWTLRQGQYNWELSPDPERKGYMYGIFHLSTVLNNVRYKGDDVNAIEWIIKKSKTCKTLNGDKELSLAQFDDGTKLVHGSHHKSKYMFEIHIEDLESVVYRSVIS